MENNTCIYCIENTITKYKYIGSAKNYILRQRMHLSQLLNNKHHSKYLQRSFNKHGIDNFRFYIIENCLLNNLLEREQYWIDLLNPEYNGCKIAGSPLGYKHTDDYKEACRQRMLGKTMSQEAREKLSKSMSGINHWTTKKPFSDEHKKKLSDIHKELALKEDYINPFKNKKHSDKTIALLGLKSSKIVLQYDLENNFIREWKSAREAAKYYNMAVTGITNVASIKESMKKYKTAKGFIWRWKENE